MKLQLTLAMPRPLTRSEAWGCVTANLAVPGAGSLAAGRAVGYAQMAVYFTGFIMTVVCAVAFFRWYMANMEQINQMKETNPAGALLLFCHAARWVFFGIALFVVALGWAAATSYQIMKSRRRDEVPPRIE
jgi:hypothetical protein